MRAILGMALALAAVTRGAAAQDEAALRAAFEGKTVTLRIDMPATSEGVEVYPLDPAPVNFRQVADRLKENGTAIRIGQQSMVTKVVVKGDSHIEFQLGGGGYGTFGDEVSNGSHVRQVSAGETKEEKALREVIKRTTDKKERRRLERELDALRSERERENSRAAAEAQQANLAHEAMVRSRRAESGSRFNIRYRNGIPPEGLRPDGVMRALAQYVAFPGASDAAPTASGAGVPAGAAFGPAGAPVGPAAGGVSALHKGQTVEEVEALLGPAATTTDGKEGSLTVTKRTYRRDGMHVAATFVSGVLIDFSIASK
jgi:hypothetical protein